MAALRLLVPLLALLVAPATAAKPTNEPSSRREAAIEALLARMTLAEKVGQLNFASHVFPPDRQLAAVRDGRIGALLNVVRSDHVRAFAAAAAASRNRIPLIFGLDAIHAFSATFPPPIAWAATWRPELAEAAAEAVARETAANGINLTFAPMVDISRDPRWGRVIEGAGEDPLLGSAFAAARVRGYRKGGLATAVKHFVGYGAPEGGRDYNGAQISTSELFDRYLPPFLAAMEAGTETVMASFNTVNGVPVTAERRLVTDLLKKRLGFDGLVMSDFAAVSELINHGVAENLAEAARKAILAGIDLDMEGKAYDKHLAAEVEAGRVPIEAVNDAVRRVLRVKYRMGLFDEKRLAGEAPEPAPRDDSAVRATARQVARESMVLVKNDTEALPITDAYRIIALIGAAADDTSKDHSWYGPAALPEPEAETLREALERRLKPGQQLRYAKGFADTCGATFGDKDEAVAAARRADIVVLVVAEDCEISGEGVSRADLGLSGAQQEMLAALVETGRPVVLVVETGRPLTLPYADRHAAAILIAWHPGTEGRTALAELLTGEVSPSGKLPMTFPRSVGQIPLSYDGLPTSRPWKGHRYTTGYVDEQMTPLYPFGHGLSYATFDYANLAFSRPSMRQSGSLEVRVTVRNTGKRKAAEVVQLYVHQRVAARSRPMRQLKGFRKIELAPGERRVLSFTLAARDLAYHDDDGRAIVEPGDFDLYVGGSSAATLAAPFTVVAD